MNEMKNNWYSADIPSVKNSMTYHSILVYVLLRLHPVHDPRGAADLALGRAQVCVVMVTPHGSFEKRACTRS